jgi:GT2 family glycosyltransferase
MDASVVVVTRDRAQRLRALLDSLRAQTADGFEVVVVDDGSRDETRDLLAHEADGLDLRVITRAEPGNLAEARNAGWREARGPLVAFIDDDCVATPGWLEEGLRAARERPGAVVQGMTEPNPAELGRSGPFTRTIEVRSLGPWFQTCNIFYPRDLLERLGGFDTAFARSGEDTDLAWRAFESGAPAAWAPRALAYHAVNELGPRGKLRVAARWSDGVRLFAKHPQKRAELLEKGVFWKGSHYLLVRALLATLVPRRWFVLRAWLAWPYFHHLRWRGRTEGGGVLFAPWYVVHDLVELWAIARGAVRHRVPML